MTRELLLSAFHTFSPTHSWPGLWRHPSDRGLEYNRIGYWTDFARLLERGLFDSLFLADTLGIHDTYGGSPDAALRHAVQAPRGEPTVLVPAMAAVTRHLAFGVTANVSFEPPFLHARRFSTLDHLTDGRVGWNIVTGHQDSGARSLGHAAQRAHDERYDLAEEYLELVYRLWEESWDDAGLRRDAAAGIYADPAHIRAIRHKGRYFELDGLHLSEPSPQRTPFLFQAGSSDRGLAFAARHAEAVFIGGSGRDRMRATINDLRVRAAAAGRGQDALRVIASATIITAATTAEAVERFESYRRHVSDEGMLALISGWSGIDFSTWDPDAPLTDLPVTNAIQSALKTMISVDPSRVWRLRDLGQFAIKGGRGTFLVGSGDEVAERLISLAEDTGLDGFNLIRVVHPETLEGVIDHLVPALQARGAFKTAYAEGSFRNKLFGRGPFLPNGHPGAGWRRKSGPAQARARA